MKYTRETIQVGDIVHIYNRGVDKRIIFTDEQDYARLLYTAAVARILDYPISALHDLYKRTIYKRGNFLQLLKILTDRYSYNISLCDVIAYTLMPNHFHFVIEQTQYEGIEKFMQKVSNAYTKYFNSRNERSGSLFEGSYKYTFVKSDYQLIHILRYLYLNPVNLNPTSSECISNWKWTSFNSDFEAYQKIPLVIKGNHLSLYKDAMNGLKNGINIKTELDRLKETLNVP